MVGGVKIVGSAQRRRSGAVLQHGSVLLTRAPLTPELPGVGDLARIPLDVPSWAALLHERIPEALGLLPEPRLASSAICDLARKRDAEVYRNPTWTWKK